MSRDEPSDAVRDETPRPSTSFAGPPPRSGEDASPSSPERGGGPRLKGVVEGRTLSPPATIERIAMDRLSLTILGAPAATANRAKRLRRTLSPPEALLWTHLRGSPSGLRFRRQHPCGPYILDFYCAAASLAIEVDGSGHADPAQQAHDARRDAWLAQHGIATIRVGGGQVLRDGFGTAAALVEAALARVKARSADGARDERARPSTSFAGPPPRSGEEASPSSPAGGGGPRPKGVVEGRTLSPPATIERIATETRTPSPTAPHPDTLPSTPKDSI
jgi:very-short-patch-repair endonuclease